MVSHLIDEGGEVVIEGLDLLLLLYSDCTNIGIQVKLQWLQKAPVHHHRVDG